MKLAAALLASGFRITLRVSGMTWVGLALFVSQHARDQADHGVNHYHRGNLSSAEDKVAD